jgi:type II secretion system protein N
MALTVGPRLRKVLMVLGFVVVGLISLLFFLQLTFPYERVKARLVDAMASKYEVTVKSVGRGIMPGKMIMEGVSLKTRVTKPDEIASTIFIPHLEIDIGLLGLIRGVAKIEVDAELGGKHLVATVSFSKQNFSLQLEGEKIPAGSLPTREYAVMPMGGLLDIHADINAPLDNNRVDWSKLEGKISLACPSNCTVGDGSYVKFPTINQRNEAMMGKGVEFGPINVDSFLAEVDMGKGVAKISKWDFKSKDGTAKLDIEIKLDKVFGNSVVEGCVRYNANDELRKRVPNTHTQIMVIGGMKGPDGLFQVHLTDRIGRMRKLSQVCPESGTIETTGERRPNLTITPDSEAVFTKKEPVTAPMPVTDIAVPPPVVAPPVVDPVAPVGGQGSSGSSGTVPTTAPTAPTVEAIKANFVAPGAGTAGASGAGEAAPPPPPEKPPEPAPSVVQ